jgi:hypothetical protein
MAAHWTYTQFEPDADLEQGDILRPTESLNDLFSKVHPHFRDDKYLGYLVTTQSCDLVVRRSAPKASYISLAVIRPLSQVLPKLVSHVAAPIATRRFKSSHRAEARRLLERLVNQNEQSLGLFFLYTDADSGIAEPAVALLRVTVAFRADHYDILRAARVGRLTAEFRAKFGWLVGNLYVRPATPDWEDTPGGQKTVKELITKCISELTWIDDEIVDEVRAWNCEVGEASMESLEFLRPPSRLERALTEVHAEVNRIDPEFSAENLRKLQNRLRNNGKFKKLFQ